MIDNTVLFLGREKMIITLDNNQIIPSSELIEATLRSSLEPCPLTFECVVKLNPEISGSLLENKILKVGKEQTAVKIILAQDTIAPWHNGNLITIRKIIALHENSAGIAQTLRRAIIRENVDLSDIYRACGGKSEVEKSFKIPKFYAFAGQTPSIEIARVCQEHGGVVQWQPNHNRLAFVRIHDLFAQEPKSISPKNADKTMKSDYLVQHEIPRYISTDESGAMIQSQISSDAAVSVKFVPHKTQAQLNAMVKLILNAKEIPCDFSPDIHAGDLAKIGHTDMVIITAAHTWRINNTGVTENLSIFWLGVKS